MTIKEYTFEVGEKPNKVRIITTASSSLAAMNKISKNELLPENQLELIGWKLIYKS